MTLYIKLLRFSRDRQIFLNKAKVLFNHDNPFSFQSCYLSTSCTTLAPDAPDPTPIKIEVSNGVRRITFNRPEKKNALNREMTRGLYAAIKGADGDDDTVVITVTGVGDYFTSGMDLTQRKSSQPHPPDLDRKKEPPGAAIAKFLSCFVECKKPLIALVNGPVVGGGVTMLGHFDAVYASDRATFQTYFARFGVPPEMASSYIFPRVMGYSRANNLLMFDRKITAEEAFRAGLVSRIFPEARFCEEVDKLVLSYGQLPVKSLMYSKQLVRERERGEIYKVSEMEQSHFDPEMARKVIKEFVARKKGESPIN